MATLECVANVLDLLVRSKPASRVDDVEKTIEAWLWALEPLGDRVIMEAAVILARTKGPHLPSPGTLFHTALDLLDKQPDAADAWALVEKYASQTLARKVDMVFNPPDLIKLPERAAKALDLIGGCRGWQKDELPFRRKEFEGRYKELGEQWRVGVSSGRLALPEGRRMIE